MTADPSKSRPSSLTDDEPVRVEDLVRVFHEAEVPPEQFRIGAEEEKFGLLEPEQRPLPYEGERSVRRVLELLAERHAWEPVSERPGGPTIALRRSDESITLEPGAQLELSGAPLRDVHGIKREKREHLAELLPLSEELGISWHSVGFHPTAQLSELPWVPKTRYPIMSRYLPTQGDGALDMMQRTCTVQVNYDYSSEEDAMRKLRVALKLSPLIHAMLANSPFYEGVRSELLSLRGDVWLRMDPSRSGLIPSLWEKQTPSYEDYVNWSLDAGMFLIWRDGHALENTGQTFRDFLKNGYQGHRATLADYRLHLSTLFPEVRLKNTLEVRPCDALPVDLSLSAIALWTGLLYGTNALSQAESLCQDFHYALMQELRPGFLARGPSAPFGGRTSGWLLAEELLTIARSGLLERGLAEEKYLEPLDRLVEQRRTPADLLLQRVAQGQSPARATRLTLLSD